MAWLKINHEDHYPVSMPCDDSAPQGYVRFVVAAHLMLRDSLDKPWERFEEAMKRMRWLADPLKNEWSDRTYG